MSKIVCQNGLILRRQSRNKKRKLLETWRMESGELEITRPEYQNPKTIPNRIRILWVMVQVQYIFFVVVISEFVIGERRRYDRCPLKIKILFWFWILYICTPWSLIVARVDKKTKFQCDQIYDIARISDTFINSRFGPVNIEQRHLPSSFRLQVCKLWLYFRSLLYSEIRIKFNQHSTYYIVGRYQRSLLVELLQVGCVLSSPPLGSWQQIFLKLI